MIIILWCCFNGSVFACFVCLYPSVPPSIRPSVLISCTNRQVFIYTFHSCASKNWVTCLVFISILFSIFFFFNFYFKPLVFSQYCYYICGLWWRCVIIISFEVFSFHTRFSCLFGIWQIQSLRQTYTFNFNVSQNFVYFYENKELLNVIKKNSEKRKRFTTSKIT